MKMKFLTRFGIGKFSLALAAAPLLLCMNAAQGAPVVIGTTANILSMGQYGNGHIFVLIDQTISQPDCPPAARFDIDGTHPNIKSILATLLMAKSNGTQIRVGTYGCYSFTFNGSNFSFPTLDNSDNSYVRLMP